MILRTLCKDGDQNAKKLLETNPGGELDTYFLKDLGIKTKVEDNGRVFPTSDSAKEVLQVLLDNLKKNKVDIMYKSPVKKLLIENNLVSAIVLENNEKVEVKTVIIATGGKSYPLTGSTGEAYNWLSKAGHSISDIYPALSQIVVKNRVESLEGLSLKDISLTLFGSGKKIATEIGDLLFTKEGLSGPSALNLSRGIKGEKDLELSLDLFPEESREELEKRIKNIFLNNSKISIKNFLGLLLPKRMVDHILSSLKIEEKKKTGEINKKEFLSLLDCLKNIKFLILGVSGFEKAMITVGGINLKEVDAKTMASKIIKNLYLAGEILDLDAPTGGYNLQMCWSTGYTAGLYAAKAKG
jgi:predicted Rossmann fold flavoprotein